MSFLAFSSFQKLLAFFDFWPLTSCSKPAMAGQVFLALHHLTFLCCSKSPSSSPLEEYLGLYWATWTIQDDLKILNLLTSIETLLPLRLWEFGTIIQAAIEHNWVHCPVFVLCTHRQQWLLSEEKCPNLVVGHIHRKRNVGTQVNRLLKKRSENVLRKTAVL